eukprot:Gb_39259 [translate_table: standard]
MSTVCECTSEHVPKRDSNLAAVEQGNEVNTHLKPNLNLLGLWMKPYDFENLKMRAMCLTKSFKRRIVLPGLNGLLVCMINRELGRCPIFSLCTTYVVDDKTKVMLKLLGRCGSNFVHYFSGAKSVPFRVLLPFPAMQFLLECCCIWWDLNCILLWKVRRVWPSARSEQEGKNRFFIIKSSVQYSIWQYLVRCLSSKPLDSCQGVLLASAFNAEHRLSSFEELEFI